MVDNKTIKALEFDKILDILSSFAVSNSTKSEILNIIPVNGHDDADELQALTAEAYITKTKYNLNPIIEFDDITQILAKSAIGAVLNMSELLKIARLTRSARILKSEISSAGADIVLLKQLVMSYIINPEIEKSINDCIAGENEMKDDASFELKNIRRKIKSAETRLKEKLSGYTRSNEVSKYLQDNLVTVRNNRFVLPVKSESRSFVPGLIHDQSSSGSTVFIEPFAVVELNNEISSLKIEEQREIDRILEYLTKIVENKANQLKICQKICIMSDIVYAKCSFSTSIKGIRPKFNNNGFVNLPDARHPLIDKNKVVPVTITFGKDFKILLITGPNTGGKTVCLKTVGLFCLMAYSGIMIPCSDDNCEIAVFDNIFCDIGDEQSILSSLSTFSSHIVNIVNITEKVTNKSLVLLDELGGGTDPLEGSALAIGIIKYLELNRVTGIITTHYSELKEYALMSDYIMNGCMQFNEDTLSPTFKLIIGLPGLSNALKIAKTLGVNDYIIKRSYEAMNEDKVKFELILQNAEQVKSDALIELEKSQNITKELENERQIIEKERKLIQQKLEKINGTAALEIKRIINNSVAKAEDIIEEMKELIKVADEQSLMKAKQKMKELENIQYLNENIDTEINYRDIENTDIKIGNKVIIKKLGTIGEIKKLPNKNGEIELLSGNITITAKAEELALAPQPKKLKDKISIDLKTNQDKPPKTEELKVLGLTVFEAIEIISPYIMSGIGQNLTLKIVHGKGTGALGRGIQKFLKSEPDVKSVRYGGYGEGDTGVTFAEIK